VNSILQLRLIGTKFAVLRWFFRWRSSHWASISTPISQKVHLIVHWKILFLINWFFFRISSLVRWIEPVWPKVCPIFRILKKIAILKVNVLKYTNKNVRIIWRIILWPAYKSSWQKKLQNFSTYTRVYTVGVNPTKLFSVFCY